MAWKVTKFVAREVVATMASRYPSHFGRALTQSAMLTCMVGPTKNYALIGFIGLSQRLVLVLINLRKATNDPQGQFIDEEFFVVKPVEFIIKGEFKDDLRREVQMFESILDDAPERSYQTGKKVLHVLNLN